MYMTSYGAAREVTGSMHLLTTDHDHILLDCGLFQGRRRESQEKNRVLPFDPKILTNVVLSHAHIDHTGRVPMLMAGGTFGGRVICTRVTADACHYLLMDSAKIQESDAEYLNYKTVRAQLQRLASAKRKEKLSKSEKRKIRELLKSNRHHLNVTKIEELIAKYRLEKVEPLYTSSDAEFALEHFDGYPYRHPVTIGRNMTCTFHEAGHILGSSLVKIKAKQNGRNYTIMFTGDIGRFDKPILRDPFRGFSEEDLDVDLLLMESTYGNRTHAPVKDIKPQLAEVIRTTYERSGSVIIPAFAYGRTQELIYTIHEIYDEGGAPRMPIYVDSPLASKITKVFAEHPEVYDEQAHETFLEKGKNPFAFKEMQFVKSVEESMALNREKKPHIVISASGM
ncbi:MAG: MBL fold metallo-hydrolase, partial [Desulfobacterales bacterium]